MTKKDLLKDKEKSLRKEIPKNAKTRIIYSTKREKNLFESGVYLKFKFGYLAFAVQSTNLNQTVICCINTVNLFKREIIDFISLPVEEYDRCIT